MFYAEDSTIGAICRPGRDQSPSKGSGTRPEGFVPDMNAVRARLLESGLYEVLDALQASADEALDALLAAIDRMTGHGGPGRACSQCGRIIERPVVSDQHHWYCSASCQNSMAACLPKPPRRRKASGAMV